MLLAPAVVVAVLTVASHVASHGRLMDPPARNSMWRLGFPNPVNYNDNELYCGGRITQWARNKGKCGVCGDAHHHTTKDHEVGGKYANGIISRQYAQGDVIEVTVHITANHKGYFEFRICPVTDPKVEVTQECLDQHVLEMTNGEGSRYHLPEGKSNQFFNVSLKLPADVTCKQCVIQWKYRTGNTWDKDESGRFCVGCGPQEEFYNCADVTINAKDSKPTENAKGVANKDTENHKNTTAGNEVKHTEPSIVFTDESFKDKITDYGKQKVKFVNKLQTNKYSSWDEPNKSISKADEEVTPAVQTSDYSRRHTGAGARFGYLGVDDSAFNFGVKASQPSDVTYKWKSDNLNNPDLENVRSRFGFASPTKKKDNGDVLRHHTNENQLEHPEKNSNPHGETEKGITREKGMKHYRKHGELHSQTKTDSHSHPAITEPTTPQSTLTTPGSEHNVLDKAVIKLHMQLRDVLHSSKINPQQRDSFLRRWKLLRLRQIAARKALNASRSSGSDNSKPLLSQPQQSQIRSSNHANNDDDRNVTPSMPLVTSPSRQGKEVRYQKEIPSASPRQILSPVTKSTELHKSNKHSTGRQTYLKHKLPSWLVTTLKMKHQGAEESNNNYNNENDEEIHSYNIINKGNSISHEANSAGKWYNSVQRIRTPSFHNSQTHLQQDSSSMNTAHKRKETAPIDISESHNDYENAEKDMLDNGVRSADAEDNDASANKHKESGVSEDTESLVRYIVKLLLARKHGHVLDKSVGKSATNQVNSDNIKKSENLSLNPIVKDNGTDGYPRSVHTTDGADYIVRKDLGNGEGKQHIRQYPNRQESGRIFDSDGQSQSSNNEQPSVRAEVQPFNGLILGSDFDYNQGQAKSTIQGNQIWETAKPYDQESVMSRQRNNLGNNFRNTDDYLHQQKSYDASYDKPINQVQYQKLEPQNPWFNSHVGGVPGTAADYHHIWSARALNRQGYYNNKREMATRSQLLCRSLVTLGGGMDQWCTDNCNANFCPPSMCVCMSSLPTSSVYAPVANPLPFHSSSRERQQQIGTEVTNHRPSVGTYRNLGYIPETGEYIRADVSSQEHVARPEFPTDNSHGSYIRSHGHIPASSMDQAMIGNAFRENKDSRNVHSINSISSESNLNRGPMRMHRSNNAIENNLDRSGYANQFYSQYLGEAPQPRPGHIPGAATGFGQGGIQNPVASYHGKDTRTGALPYISNNIMGSDFQDYDTNSDSSINTKWLPNTRTVFENHPQQRIHRDNMIKPYISHKNEADNTLISASDRFSRSKAYAVPEVVGGQSFVGQNQFYPQFSSMNNRNRQEVPPTLKCKAIGPYAGLKHFDEWCDTTCQSAMCPLLICSCDS